MKTVYLRVSLGIAILSIVVVSLLGGRPTPAQALSGSFGIHDPSVMQAGSCYYAFGTGTWLPILRSCGSPFGPWSFLRNTFSSLPSWIPGAIGATPGNLWAPDINFVNGQYRLYYAASTFGTNRSAIGLATASNIEGPWTDAGEVLRSTTSNNYNAIDPDYIEGKLAFGSFWDGIKMIDIGSDGKRSGTAMFNLASRGGGAIEAASILHSGSFYYLFVSFDTCCQGVNSTYRTMVGRSSSLTGPYTAQDGTAMMSGGATQLLARNGNEIGPGGGDANGLPGFFAYHFYDGAANGAAKLNIRPISFSNGWPVFGAPITSGCCTTTPTPTPGGTTIQAEAGTVGGGTTIDSNNAGFNGTGFANFPASGGSLQFSNLAAGTGGSRTLQIRYALGASGSRTGQLLINGAAQSITFNSTGAWTTWTTMSVAITLNSGSSNTIRFQSNGQDLGNIDQVTIN
jgi:beta-xylosidase